MKSCSPNLMRRVGVRNSLTINNLGKKTMKPQRIEFKDILNARFENKADKHVANNLHNIGISINSIATVAENNLNEAKSQGRSELNAQFSCSVVLKWMEEIDGLIQNALQETIKNQPK